MAGSRVQTGKWYPPVGERLKSAEGRKSAGCPKTLIPACAGTTLLRQIVTPDTSITAPLM